MKSLVLAAMIPLLALAAGIDGQWKGQINGGGDSIFALKTDGAKIAGTMTGPDGKAHPITKGEIQGSDVTFTIASEWQGNPVTLIAKGKVEGDQMTLTLGNEDGGWSTDLTLKRAH